MVLARVVIDGGDGGGGGGIGDDGGRGGGGIVVVAVGVVVDGGGAPGGIREVARQCERVITVSSCAGRSAEMDDNKVMNNADRESSRRAVAKRFIEKHDHEISRQFDPE